MGVRIVEYFYPGFLEYGRDKRDQVWIAQRAVGLGPCFDDRWLHPARPGEIGHGDARNVHGDIENRTWQWLYWIWRNVETVVILAHHVRPAMRGGNVPRDVEKGVAALPALSL